MTCDKPACPLWPLSCEDFTKQNLGAIAARLSYKELHERTQGRLTPLARAWHAYDFLDDSPLVFKRPKKAEDLDYGEVAPAWTQPRPPKK